MHFTKSLLFLPLLTNHVIKTNQDIGTFIAFISVKIIQQPDQLQKHLDF